MLLVLPRGPFEQLFNGEDAISRVFLEVIQRDIVATLRETLRPLARQASARPVPQASPAVPLPAAEEQGGPRSRHPIGRTRFGSS